MAACDENDPLLDTDESTAYKFASRGIYSGAVAAQSIQHSGLLRSSTENQVCISSAPPPHLDEVRWPVACHLEDELEDDMTYCFDRWWLAAGSGVVVAGVVINGSNGGNVNGGGNDGGG